MPVTALTIGPVHSILQNVVYAMPAKVVKIHSSVPVEISSDGASWDALTNADTTGTDAAGIFLRCPTAACIVTLKSY